MNLHMSILIASRELEMYLCAVCVMILVYDFFYCIIYIGIKPVLAVSI